MDSAEEVNVSAKNAGNGMLAVLYCIIFCMYTKFSQILEVLQDFHHLFRSRNSPTTGILHTICHVYRSVWPAGGAKPHSGATLKCSAHDWETYKQMTTDNFIF